MRRRDFIHLLGGAMAATPLGARAQTPSKIYRLGTLSAAAPFAETSPFGSILIRALAQRGYTLGQNLQLKALGASGELGRLPQLLQEMAAGNVDVVVATGYPTAVAAKAAGIPTVMAVGVGDPVATGLVASLARPG